MGTPQYLLYLVSRRKVENLALKDLGWMKISIALEARWLAVRKIWVVKEKISTPLDCFEQNLAEVRAQPAFLAVIRF